MRRYFPNRFPAFILALLLFSACGERQEKDARPLVITSIAPLGDWVRAVGGDDVRVAVLLPRSADPHTFELRPTQLRQAADASLAVFMGAGLEFWSDKLLANADAELRVLTLSEGQHLLQSAHDDDAHGHHHAEGNPHLWLDPVFAKESTGRIADALVSLLPEKAEGIRNRAQAWEDSLTALDASIRETRTRWTRHSFVADHSSWLYFAARYGLEQRGVLEATPGREISAKEMGALIDLMRADDIHAIFTDVRKSTHAVEVLAESTDARVALLDPIGSDASALHYLELMHYNVAEITRVLK
ncbi:metal ABC transporter substrate-binding protein [bacterium]|nr:metal ABC transporter substrate-binding protein [bacterium]